jgi:hypothetical protein
MSRRALASPSVLAIAIPTLSAGSSPIVVAFTIKTLVAGRLSSPRSVRSDVAKKLNAITFDKLAEKARAARIVYPTAINVEFARLLPKLRLAKETAKL